MKAMLKKGDLEVGKTYFMYRNASLEHVRYLCEVKEVNNVVVVHMHMADDFETDIALSMINELCLFVEFN